MKPLNDKYLWDMIDRLRDNIEELKLLSCDDDCQDNINLMIKLGAEVKELKLENQNTYIHLNAKVNRLQAENKRLNDKDGLYDEVMELQEENKALKEQVNDLMIDKDRLVEQVSSNRGNSSSTHTQTISKEVQDYMNHHPEHKEVRLFILPSDDFADGDYNHGVYWDEGIEV